MRAAATIDELFAPGDEPRCYVARRFLFWAASPEIGGHAVWGAPDRSDAEQFVAVLERGLGEARTPAQLIVDFHELRTIESSAFELVLRYVDRHKHEIDRQVVVVRPGGRVGATVAGFFRVAELSQAREVAVVTTLAEACQRLGRADVIPLAQQAYLLREARTEHHATVDRLRELLASDAPPQSIAKVAAALRMPARTLQHHLRAAGTTYRRERSRARLDRAAGLLRGGVKLASVALEVGFSTPQHFSVWFKRQTGMTPSAWRQRHAQ